jgi:hypothetical protein
MQIISATNPVRYVGHCEVWLKVWFAEFDGPLEPYCASPFDCEVHGKELWIRAMAGEYGPVEIREPPKSAHADEVRMITYGSNR